MKRALVVVYSHVEFYPPTINAIEVLSEKYDDVIILHRNTKVKKYIFADNVKEFISGDFVSINDTQIKSYWWKLKSFFSFCKLFYKLIKDYKPGLILIYDPIPLLSYKIIQTFVNVDAKTWYHNHDLLTENNVKRFSISWFAMLNEKSFIHNVDVFSLPTQLRMMYFNSNNISLLPNYPSLKLISKINNISKPKLESDKFKIIYQGVISEGHGIEEIIMSASIIQNIEFSIVGFYNDDYLVKLRELINTCNVDSKVKIYPFFDDYKSLLTFTSEHDIGVGLYMSNNEMNKTMGTASNKIFEYIACGLVVLLNDTPFYRDLFKSNDCIFFTEINQNAITNSIQSIILNKIKLNCNSSISFEKDFYFEKQFLPILESLNDSI